jgi:LCP family protein required for cell wall assembly
MRGPHRRRLAEWAALLSALLPGLGQWWLGRRRRGLLLALPAIAGLLVVLWVALSVRRDGASGLLEILVQPRWLWLLVVVNALLAAERLVAVADAWWPLRRPADRSAGTWALRATAAVLATLMVAPHVVVHVYASEALDLFDTVFAADEVPSLAEREEALLAEGYTEEDLGPVTTTTTLPPATTTTVGTTPTSQATSTTRTTISPTPSIGEIPGLDPIPTYDNPLGQRYTVLLAGGDFGPGRHDLRTDVMIVASLDVLAGKASLIGVSRELVGAPLPPAWADSQTMRNVQRWHEDQAYKRIVAEAEEAEEEPPEQVRQPFCYCNADRINYLHVLTATWVRTFPDAPDPGMEALRQTLELLLGIPIDAYVLVDFAGFVDLVDAIGGVRVTVTESMDVGFSPAKEGEDPVRVSVEPGRHLLDGREALAYVRNRTGSSDAERMRRQRCMIRELAATADAGTLIRNFTDIARAIRTSTTTTMPLDLLPAIIDTLGSLDQEDIATMYIGGSRFSRGRNWLGIPIVNPPVVRSGVAEFLTEVSAGTTLGAAEDECG